MANTYLGNYAKRNYLCHFARVILYFQGTYGFCNWADSLFPIPTVTICKLWFIRLSENTSIYQLWGSTDCSGAVQAASLASATSKGVGAGKEGKGGGGNGNRRKVGVWGMVVSAAAAPVSVLSLSSSGPASHSLPGTVHTGPAFHVPSTFLLLSLLFYESVFVLQSSANMFEVSVLCVRCAWGLD